MVFKKSPTYLWAKPSGLLFFKRGIPEPLRKHYPSDTPGKFKTHIVECLHTHDPAVAKRLKIPLMAKYEREFQQLAAGVPPTKTINPALTRVPELRKAMAGAVEADDQEGQWVVESMAREMAHELAAKDPFGAGVAFSRIVNPGRPTVLEALEVLATDATGTAQTVEAYRLHVRELLEFLKVPDCTPEEITEALALAYVDALDSGALSKTSKSRRLGTLNTLWRSMRRKGWPRSPWAGHSLREAPKPQKEEGEEGGEDESEDVRPFTTAEAVHVLTLAPPADKRKRTYTRGLIREFYALGFITGMRLNEIASLRVRDVEMLPNDGREWRALSVPKAIAKTPAGVRTLPVCHPVAVALLDRRLKALGENPDPLAPLFPECATGGPDKKRSWHVGKAMSRERKERLKLSEGVNYHSTRRSFASIMEESDSDDTTGQQRYMGHEIPSMMHKSYSGGSGLRKLKRLAVLLQYPEELQRALALALER